MERIETMNTGRIAGKNSTGKTYNDYITCAVNPSPSLSPLSSEKQHLQHQHQQAEEIKLTPAQAAAEASSNNPYNLSKKKDRNSKNVAIAYDKSDSNDNNNKNKCVKTISNSKSIITIWFDKCIDTIAYVIARIMNHPDVRDAVSTAILEGMIKVCYDDNLHNHIKNVDATLSEFQVEGATKKGKDTKKIVKAYLGGIFNLDNSSNSITTNDTEDNGITTTTTTTGSSGDNNKNKWMNKYMDL